MATDTFQYTGTLSSNWTPVSSNFTVTTGSCTAADGTLDLAFYNGTFTNDQSASVTYSTLGGNEKGPGPAVRITSADNGYIILVNSNGFQLLVLNSGNGSLLTSSSTSPVQGHTYTLAVQGSNLTFTDATASTTLLTYSDSTYTSGNPGLASYDSDGATAISSWTGLSLGAAASSPALLFL